MGVVQNYRAGAQVLVLGSIYQGAILVHRFEPHPFAPERGRHVANKRGQQQALEVCTLLVASQTERTLTGRGWHRHNKPPLETAALKAM